MTRTPESLKAARRQLGWSVYQLARALRMAPEDSTRDDQQGKKAGDRIREMEDGRRDISGPVSVAVEAFLAGFRPRGFRE